MYFLEPEGVLDQPSVSIMAWAGQKFPNTREISGHMNRKRSSACI